MIDLSESSVTHIVSGHLHEALNEVIKEKNIKNSPIQRARVGTPFIGAPGWEKETSPIIYSVEIDPDSENQVIVEAIKTSAGGPSSLAVPVLASENSGILPSKDFRLPPMEASEV